MRRRGDGQGARAFAPAPDGAPLPGRRVLACRFESGEGDAVDVALARPVVVASRLELDGWLLRRAIDAGARHVAERVTAVGDRGVTVGGRLHACDVVVGADGAGSLVRRTFLSPTPPARLALAAGWFAPRLAMSSAHAGWPLLGLFPRADHVAWHRPRWPRSPPRPRRPLGGIALRSRVANDDDAGVRPNHPLALAGRVPIREIGASAGRWWATPPRAILPRGHLLRPSSAVLLAETLREAGSPRRYPERALADFGADLLKAAALHARFFAPGFSRRMIRYAGRSRAIRGVLGDLVLGDQGYVGLKRRLARSAPRFALESVGAAFSGGSAGRP